MSQDEIGLRSLHSRLAALEKSHDRLVKQRRWMIVACLALLFLVGTLLLQGSPALGETKAGQDQPKVKTVEAGRFILRDEKGRLRAELGIDKHGSHLALFDEQGQRRALLRGHKDRPVLSLTDETGKLHAGMIVTKTGGIGLPRLDEDCNLLSP